MGHPHMVFRAGTIVVLLTASLVLPSGATEAQQQTRRVDWEAIDPTFKGATFVRDAAQCADCHDKSTHSFKSTAHAAAFSNGKSPAEGACETCHGPASKHLEDPDVQVKWTSLSAEEQTTVCSQCHQSGTRFNFASGPHRSADVSCTSCHSVMAEKSAGALLRTPRETETCYSCHADKRAQMSKASHHPVREGKMECSGCHNPHGSGENLLRQPSLNETCYSCHSEKRGPYLWEHAPAKENCASCHDAHGSTNRNLLNRKDSFVCLQCHSYGGHINLPRYNRTSNPTGSGCVNCHMAVHGSNHPSGAKLTR